MITRRLLSISVVFLFCAGSVAAQPFPTDAPPEMILKLVLELSDEQFRMIQESQQKRREALAPLVARMTELQQALQRAMQSDSPGAVEIGELILGMRSISQQAAEEEQRSRLATFALLTDEQRARVDMIHGIEMAIHAAGVLRHFGL